LLLPTTSAARIKNIGIQRKFSIEIKADISY
jgi:hypothetical protein